MEDLLLTTHNIKVETGVVREVWVQNLKILNIKTEGGVLKVPTQEEAEKLLFCKEERASKKIIHNRGYDEKTRQILMERKQEAEAEKAEQEADYISDLGEAGIESDIGEDSGDEEVTNKKVNEANWKQEQAKTRGLMGNGSKGKNRKTSHACTECGFAADYKSKLERHIKAVHEKVKDFSCQLCNYTASQKSNIKLHMKQKHNNEKNYNCGECGYKSAMKETLERHKKVHNKDNKEGYQQCPACLYTALQGADIKKHARSVHLNLKDKACKECSYATSRMGNLKEHIRRKHAKK